MAEQKLQAEINDAIIDAIKCTNCKRDLNKVQLYQCNYRRCPNQKQVYCKICGELSHLEIEGHNFTPVNNYIKQITKKTTDLSLVKRGSTNLELMLANNFKAVQVIASSGAVALSQLAKAGRAMYLVGNSSSVTMSIANTVVDSSLAMAKATPMAIAIGVGLDVLIHTIRFWKGDIETWKEYGWYCARSVSVATTSAGGGYVGAVCGAAVGTAICPRIGTTICGAIGSLIGALVSGVVAAKGLDQIWPNPNQKKRMEIVYEAVSWFHFKKDQIKDKKIFNKREIMKRYKKFAKMYHPDRKNGNIEKWNELQMALGILLALVDKSNSKKNRAVKIMKAIKYK